MTDEQFENMLEMQAMKEGVSYKDVYNHLRSISILQLLALVARAQENRNETI